jgi:D-glucuronyl C5-epimerase C-terminus
LSRCFAITAALAALVGTSSAVAAPPIDQPERSARAVGPVVHARPADDARVILAGLRRATAAGRLTGAEAARYRMTVARTRAVLRLLPGSRYETLARVLNLVRRQAGAFNAPRALTLFAMLEQNRRFFALRGVPPHKSDFEGDGGVVYRAGWGYGLNFHPLANAVALNAHLLAGRDRQAGALARALAARLVPRRQGAVLEYLFPYNGGRPPWTSGMAQAVLAQAFARASERLNDPALAAAARRAYRSIPAHVFQVSGHPWVRLYSFNSLVVLNAQLQAVLSIADYARRVGDEEATGLSDRLLASSKTLFPRFDTGYWSRYALGWEAPLEYHLYHIDLLTWLHGRTGDSFWAQARQRFIRYRREPPAFRPGPPRPVLYPWPADGFRDETKITFWVSKVSSVTLRVGGDVRSIRAPGGGWYSLVWRPGRRAPGTYRPTVTAVDLAGNRGSASLRPLTIAVDREPPTVTASVERRRLSWRAVDRTTPWITLTLALERAGETRTVPLGRRPHAGALTLPLPPGNWNAVLVAADSSGNRARVELGVVPAAPG